MIPAVEELIRDLVLLIPDLLTVKDSATAAEALKATKSCIEAALAVVEARA